MKHGFQNTQGLRNSSFDGGNVIAIDRLYFVDRLGNYYRTAAYLHTDGGSVPPLGVIGGVVVFVAHWMCHFSSWFNLLAVFGIVTCLAGLYLMSYAEWWWSYILHDAAYQDNLERWSDQKQVWVKSTLTEHESNNLLYDAMSTQKALFWEYFVVWFALELCGWRAFDEDRKRAANRWHRK